MSRPFSDRLAKWHLRSFWVNGSTMAFFAVELLEQQPRLRFRFCLVSHPLWSGDDLAWSMDVCGCVLRPTPRSRGLWMRQALGRLRRPGYARGGLPSTNLSTLTAGTAKAWARSGDSRGASVPRPCRLGSLQRRRRRASPAPILCARGPRAPRRQATQGPPPPTPRPRRLRKIRRQSTQGSPPTPCLRPSRWLR